MAKEGVSTTSPLDVFMAIPDERWREIAKEFKQDPEYGLHQTTKNLSLLLKVIGINVPMTKEQNQQLLTGEQNRTNDIIYSLCTNQPDWFDRIIPPEDEKILSDSSDLH